MGTISLDLRLNNDLTNKMQNSLRDFERYDNYMEKSVEGEKVREQKRGAYDLVFMKKVENTTVTVLASPKLYFTQLPRYRIILHLSQFPNLYMVWVLLVDLFKEELARFIYFVATVSRLDVWYDTKNSYKACLRAFYKKGIAATEEYKASKGNKKGTYFGSKKSLIYYFVYQKMKKVVNGINVTRIEKRYKNKACPIKHLSEYDKLLEIKVFNDLAIYAPKISFQKTLDQEKLTLDQKVVLFLTEYLDDGLQCARKEVSRCKSFNSIVWPFFTSNCDLVSLNDNYHARLKKFVTSTEVAWA